MEDKLIVAYRRRRTSQSDDEEDNDNTVGGSPPSALPTRSMPRRAAYVGTDLVVIKLTNTAQDQEG